MKILILILLITSQVICQDFTSLEYQAKTRQEKFELLWAAITENLESGKFHSLEAFKEFFKIPMDVTINFESDVLPEGREKYLHCIGVVAKVEFIPEPDTEYLGLFQGADSAIIRFSLSFEPDYSKPEAMFAKGNFIPSMAIKFLVDGKPSINVVAQFSADGIDSFNFFGQDMSTHIPDSVSAFANQILKQFSTATNVVKFTGLQGLSLTNQDGSLNLNAKFPFKLTFKALQEIKDLFTEDFGLDFRLIISKILPGQNLLEVYATEDPETGCKKKVGTIRATTQFTTSKFADEKLFFQHQDFQLDLEVYSEWLPYTPKVKSPVCYVGKNLGKTIKYPLPEGGCPFLQLKK